MISGRLAGFLLQLSVITALATSMGASLAAPAVRAQTDPAARITTCMQDEMASRGTVGAQIAVMRGGVMLYERGFGRKHRDRPDLVDTGTMFRIGSTTKTLTALALMQLVEQGRLDLDLPITTYLDDFALAEPGQAEAITTRHLLTHSSGLHDTSAMSEADFWGTQEPGAMRAWVDRQRGQQPYAPPGRFWNYSSANYMYAGQILERITGETYPNYMDDRVFEPAGMTNTTMHAAEGVARGNFAYGHYNSPFSGMLEIFTLDEANNWARHPTGYANATAGDLVRFAALMMDGGRALLSADSVQAMTTRQRHRDLRADQYYGLGTFVEYFDGNEMVHHDGGAWGWTATMKWIPEAGVAVATTTNGGGLLQSATACALRAYVPRGPDRSTPCRLDRERWNDFVGTYEGSVNSGVSWNFEITRPGGGNLQMRLIREGEEDRVEMLGQDCGRWVNAGPGTFNAPGLGEITFIDDPVEPGVVWLRNRFFVAGKRPVGAEATSTAVATSVATATPTPISTSTATAEAQDEVHRIYLPALMRGE